MLQHRAVILWNLIYGFNVVSDIIRKAKRHTEKKIKEMKRWMAEEKKEREKSKAHR